MSNLYCSCTHSKEDFHQSMIYLIGIIPLRNLTLLYPETLSCQYPITGCSWAPALWCGNIDWLDSGQFSCRQLQMLWILNFKFKNFKHPLRMFKEQGVVPYVFNPSTLGTEAELVYIVGPYIGNPSTNSFSDNVWRKCSGAINQASARFSLPKYHWHLLPSSTSFIHVDLK